MVIAVVPFGFDRRHLDKAETSFALRSVCTVVPFEFNRRGYQILAYLVVDISFVSLTELVAAFHTVHLTVLDEMGARLMEAGKDVL